ncbi:hypothetical protein NB636_02800 [Oxalobacter aliiformigenes]|uniref:hypothetical protein n=1 Tax=Oxalobacter aliiformigenes TaxID=2946593 RepID=UPI0022AFBD5D|nr:hypothetical protein [Oxalobacter aliiformigenes]MCZ4064456.1 hypothetical protein [Oxalobacter aliiformigenes]WAV99800.1 hypothetical protein NB636_02800 [Oxalobacter aliiformigenes]
MRHCFKSFILLLFVLLAACSKPRQIAINGAPLHEPSKTAILQEGSLFFRGLDGRHLDLADTPNPYDNVVFVVTAGKHVIGAMNIQGGHFAMPEDLRCYRIEADLQPGMEYMIAEDKELRVAYVKRKDNNVRIATARPFETQAAYSGGCNWK